MRMQTVAAGLLCLSSTVGARADRIKDLDGWTKRFTEAVGHSDISAMMTLVRPCAATQFDLDPIEKTNIILKDSENLQPT